MPDFFSQLSNTLKESLKQVSGASIKPTYGPVTPPTRVVEPEPMDQKVKLDWLDPLRTASFFTGIPGDIASGGELPAKLGLGGQIQKIFESSTVPAVQGLAPLMGVLGGFAEPIGGVGKAGQQAIKLGKELAGLKGVKESLDLIKRELPDLSEELAVRFSRKYAPMTDSVKIAEDLSRSIELIKRNTEPATKLSPALRIAPDVMLKASLDAGVDLSKVARAIDTATPLEVTRIVDDLRFTLTQVDPSITKTPIEKLLQAMREAKPDIKDVEVAQTAERGKRIESFKDFFESSPTQAGAQKALGKLSGELVQKPAIDPVQSRLSQSDVDSLFKEIKDSSMVDEWEKVTAIGALNKLLQGRLPVRSELSILEDIYGRGVIDAALDWRPMWQKVAEGALSAINLTKTLRSILDFSAVLRQGLILTASHPVRAAGAVKEMFRQTFSQKNFEQWFVDLQKSPDWALIKKGDLYVANPLRASGGLTAREEAFSSNLAEKIPILNAMVGASERAYVAYLNKIRVDVYLDLAKQMQKEGVSNPKALKALGSFVNNATGRGSLGKFEAAAQALNVAFFSPRLVAARFNMLNPGWYVKTYMESPFVAKQALKDMLITVGSVSSILTLASASGMAEVETDPRSPDFGKMRIGNVRIDPWGGFQQWVRMATQVFTGQQKSSTTGVISDLRADKYPYATRLSKVADFARSKLAPTPSYLFSALEGETPLGEEITPTNTAVSLFVPLYLEGLHEVYEEIGPSALLPPIAAASMFGVGAQAYGNASPTELLKQKYGLGTAGGNPEIQRLKEKYGLTGGKSDLDEIKKKYGL